MADEKPKWKQFNKLSFDSHSLSRHVKKAEGATTRHAHKFIIKRLSNIRSARRQIVAWLLLIGVMIVAVGVQLIWFREGYQTAAPAEGGTYAEASIGPIDTLNPLYAATNAEVAASRLMFSSLYSYDKTGHLTGDLAEGMKVDESGKVYTVVIRSDAKWHDGTALTAKDVAFTINLIKDDEARSPLRVNWQDVKVEAVNDTTIRFTLPAVYAAFPYALNVSILPRHILANIPPGAIRENTFSRAPVGSGPFSFRLLQTADGESGHQIVHMNAFEEYYQGAPKLGRFEVHAYQAQEGMVDALKSVEVAAAAQVSPQGVAQLDPNEYSVISQPVSSGVFALFNMNKAPFKDENVRKALQLATDTKAIRDAIGSNPRPLTSPFIDGQLTGKDIPKTLGVNVKAAQKILDDAGWKLNKDGIRQKDGAKLSITISTTKDEQYQKVVELLISQWQAVGVEVSANIIDTNNPATNFVQNTLQPRNFDVLVYELIIGADPDVYAYWHSSQIGMRGYNFSNYSNSTADAALASARSRLESELRNAKYKTFASQWIADVPAIALYQPVVQYVASKTVNSVDPTAKLITPVDRFENILYWSVREEPVYKTP